MIDPQRVLEQFLDVAVIPGVSRNERQIIDYVKNFLGKLGFAHFEDNAFEGFGGNTGNVICKVYNSESNKTILLAAHVDTVTLSSENPILKNGRIMSSDDRILGADDRGGVTVLLELLKLISNKKIAYPNVEVVFLVGEEIGLLGSKDLDYSNLRAKEGFNFDCSAAVGQVVVEAPTALDFTIRFIGKEAHSAVAPHNGINAISMATHSLAKIDLPQKNGDTVFNIAKINGGDHNNVIPGEVTVGGEIRSFDRENVDSYLEQIGSVAESVVKGYEGSFEFNHKLRYSSFRLSQNSSVLRIARAAIENSNSKFVPIQYFAGSDANIFNEKKIAAVNLGLGYVNNHSPDEYYDLSDLSKSVEIGARMVEIAAGMN